MTDTTQLIPNNLAVTSDLDYRLKPSAPRSRSYRASILPSNKNTFNPTDTAIIYIPGGRRNTYLDCSQSYIRMTILNTQSKKQPISEASTFEHFDLWKFRLFVSAAIVGCPCS